MTQLEWQINLSLPSRNCSSIVVWYRAPICAFYCKEYEWIKIVREACNTMKLCILGFMVIVAVITIKKGPCLLQVAALVTCLVSLKDGAPWHNLMSL